MEIKDILDYVTWAPRNNNINVLKAMLETLIEEYSISDIGSIGVEDIIEYVELTPHNSNVNVLRIMLESLISPEPVVEGEAYAVFDSADGSLVFFRDKPEKYSEGQIKDTKTYYTGVETRTVGFGWWGSINPTSVRFNDEITPISTLDWFRHFSGLTFIIGLDKLNTSNVTNMAGMFDGCDVLTSIDLTGFDTSNVTNMSSMFRNCRALTSLDVSGFDTSNVIYMTSMFDNCIGLTSIDVSGFNTSKVIDMNGMFQRCSALTSIDVSGFDISNVTDMNGMFYGCSSLTTDITISDISKYPDTMFINAATIPPAKITLYGEGEVTSADIDTFITSVKADSPDSNVVNGMLSSNVVFDEDVVWDFEGLNPPAYPILSPLIPIEDSSISVDKYRVQFTNPQMRQGYADNWGDWADAIVREPYPEDYYIESNDERRKSYSTYIYNEDNIWRLQLSDESGEGYAPTKFHVYVEKKD